MAISDDQLEALGRLTVEFSFLEFMILNLAVRLSGDAVSTLILASALPYRRLCHTTLAVAKEKMKTTPAVADELKQIIDRALRLEDDRNRLIHSIWTALGPPGGPAPEPGSPLSRIKITAKGKFAVQLDFALPAENIKRVADEIRETAVEVILFMKKRLGWPEPLESKAERGGTR